MTSTNNSKKPPILASNTPSTLVPPTYGVDGAALGSLSAKGTRDGSGTLQPSKWAINIQEIVKRTQKNLERGPPGSSKAASGADRRTLEVGQNEGLQYLSKQTKVGFGSSSTKDKNSLLYNDLKKKLSYDSAPGGMNPISSVGVAAANASAGLNRRENLLGVATG